MCACVCVMCVCDTSEREWSWYLKRFKRQVDGTLVEILE